MSRIATSAYVFLFCIISTVTATNFSFDGVFDQTACYARTLLLIANGTLALDDGVFFRDNSGRPMSNPNNVTLTPPGCRQLCGPSQSWYWDSGPRLSTWLIPILLLVSNVDLSPLDKRRFMAILHLLGDPIDSIWSLLHKIDAWYCCHELAGKYGEICPRRRRIIATVFAGFEEIEGLGINSKSYFDRLVEDSGLGREDQFREWRRTASELADSRTDELLRTCLAIFLYIYQVIASFVSQLGGGETSPPGGRIGTAMFISWLVPVVLLSNTIGSFTSRRSCLTIMSRFLERTHNPYVVLHSRESVLLQGLVFGGWTSKTEYFESLSWSTAIDTFRPWKTQYITGEVNRLRTCKILFLSVLPLCIGMIGGFIIIWNTDPIGFNCRHLWLIGILFAWVVSALITWLSFSPHFATGKYHWRFVLVKDALVAIPSIIVIFLSSSGLFNSCFCWSGYFYYHSGAHVPLNTEPFYDYNDSTLYPAAVAICLFLQCLTFAIFAVSWREGLGVMRWGERTRREESDTAFPGGGGGSKCCVCESAIGHSPWGLLRLCYGLSVGRWSRIRTQVCQESQHMHCPCKSMEMVAMQDKGKNQDTELQLQYDSKNQDTELQLQKNSGNQDTELQLPNDSRNQDTEVQLQNSRGNEDTELQLQNSSGNEDMELQPQNGNGNEDTELQALQRGSVKGNP